MEPYDRRTPVLRTVISWVVAAVVVILGVKLLFWGFGLAAGILTFVLFTVLPALVVFWLATTLIRYFRRRDSDLV
jgi:Na+-translocating ferredoxin:NAD+ oxidoreductase RnfD subunit